MPSLKDIRNRVRSVKNTQKITRAMKLVAGAKLKKAQEAVSAARPYAILMRQVIASVAATCEPEEHPLFRSEQPPRRVLVIPMTSDRGLCGGFNSSILRRMDDFLHHSADGFEAVELAPVGRRGRDYYRRRDRQSVLDTETIVQAPNAVAAKALTAEIIKRFTDGEFDTIYLLYNEFKSALTQEVIFEQLLPLNPAILTAETDGPTEYIFEPSHDELLNEMLPRYVESQVLTALLDSNASEIGSRMTAMDSATTNAGDLIDKLTLQMNRARQAAITTELMEITSGAEALKG